MRRNHLALSLLLFFASGAYACPNLSGHFNCPDNDTDEAVEIKQTIGQQGDILSLNDSELVIDDKDHSVTDDPTFRNAVVHISCDEHAVRKRVTGDFYDGEQKVGEMDSLTEFSLVEGAFIQTVQGTMRNSVGETPLNDKITCARDAN